MEALQHSGLIDLPRPSNRKVWILNWFPKAFKEEFRGNIREIPGNNAKDPAKNLWGIMEAERFLGQARTLPGQQSPDGTWLSQPKSLRIVELTEDEIEKYEKRTVQDRKKAIKEEEVALKFSCPICEKSLKTRAALKRHTTMDHPEFEALPEK